MAEMIVEVHDQLRRSADPDIRDDMEDAGATDER